MGQVLLPSGTLQRAAQKLSPSYWFTGSVSLSPSAGCPDPGQAGPAGLRLPCPSVCSHPVWGDFLQPAGAELQYPVHLPACGGGPQPGRDRGFHTSASEPLLPEEPGGRARVLGPPRPQTGQVHPGLLPELQGAREEGTSPPHSRAAHQLKVIHFPFKTMQALNNCWSFHRTLWTTSTPSVFSVFWGTLAWWGEPDCCHTHLPLQKNQLTIAFLLSYFAENSGQAGAADDSAQTGRGGKINPPPPCSWCDV